MKKQVIGQKLLFLVLSVSAMLLVAMLCAGCSVVKASEQAPRKDLTVLDIQSAKGVGAHSHS